MLESRIVQGIELDPRTPRQISAEFRSLLEGGARLRPVGQAKNDPDVLVDRGYLPRHKVQLFDATYYLTDIFFDHNIRFFVAYIGLASASGRIRELHPRLFYKDYSLLWRVATHFIYTENENWIGKGDLKWVTEDGERFQSSCEETTNLPLEIQAALDTASRSGRKPKKDEDVMSLVLRSAPEGRLAPYSDFSTPRRRAAEKHSINGGRKIATFRRKNDPTSLRFARGFEPDFKKGVLEVVVSASKLYDGKIRKFRILSKNREVQYPFLAARRHVWINPPQALTTDISSYGVRTVDVHTDDDLCVPGFEYHYLDDHEDPPEFHSQIPEGFAGESSKVDPSRADASAWIEKMPVIARFRREVLGHKARARS